MTFTASSGGTVAVDASGRMLVTDYTRVVLREGVTRASRAVHIDAEMVPTLREFFQSERDRELGRWRWPEHPDYVVYPNEDGGGDVLDERSCIGGYKNGLFGHDLASEAVKAYRDVHPVRKPWHDAKPGEVWVISTENVADEVAVRACISNEVLSFEYVTSVTTRLNVTDARIVTGRRIWPEAS